MQTHIEIYSSYNINELSRRRKKKREKPTNDTVQVRDAVAAVKRTARVASFEVVQTTLIKMDDYSSKEFLSKPPFVRHIVEIYVGDIAK